MGIVGIWKKIPFLMLVAGSMIAFWAVTTDNIIMESFASGNTDNLYSYNQENVDDTPASLNSGGTIAYVEFASASNSALVGDEIDCIDIYIAKIGSPTGIATIGVFVNQTTPSIGTVFGTIQASTLTTTNQWKTFCLSSGTTYTIQKQDRLGVLFNNGSVGNAVAVWGTSSNPFDGTITYRQANTGAVWTSNTAVDTTARFYLQGSGLEIIPNIYQFTEYPKILFALLGSMLLIGGALMWKMDE